MGSEHRIAFPVPRSRGRAHGDQPAVALQASRRADVFEKAHPFVRDKWIVREVAARLGAARAQPTIKIGFWTTIFQRMDVAAGLFRAVARSRSVRDFGGGFDECRSRRPTRTCGCACCTSTCGPRLSGGPQRSTKPRAPRPACRHPTRVGYNDATHTTMVFAYVGPGAGFTVLGTGFVTLAICCF
jgi:hypothetical protein